MPETLFSLSACDSLSAFHPTQHTAAYIQLTHEEILHEKQKTVAPQKKKKKESLSPRAPRHNVKPFGKDRKKVIQDSVDWLEVFRLSIWCDLLISLLFWRISIRYRAFVEGSLCPPKHFPNTRVSAPSLPPFSSLVCQITFPTQPQYPRQQPLLWAYTIVRVWSLWCMSCQYSWEERCEGGWGGEETLYKLWEH